MSVVQSLSLGLLAVAVIPAWAGDPWADRVISYTPGSALGSGFTTPEVALGRPERFSGEGIFPGAVTPFSPAWGADELVAIGEGGSLIVAFDRPVRDDARNPFGIDLLIFGNSGFIDQSYPNGIAGGLFGGGDGGRIDVSEDGVVWVSIPSVQADGMFPTLGYRDLLDPYSTVRGRVRTDFTRPVDPSLGTFGLSFAQVVAGYQGSGGGAGVDLAGTGLRSISYVRITGTAATADIDAMADVRAVPSPGAIGLVTLGLALGRRRR